MTQEDYVSFETAKLLKEKGFDVPCLAHWFIGNEAHEKFSDYPFNWNEVKSDLDWLSRPTLQMAMKWLREVHNIAINIGWGEILEDKFQWWCIILNQKDGHILRESEYYATYEEAVEEAIKYCLEHLI